MQGAGYDKAELCGNCVLGCLHLDESFRRSDDSSPVVDVLLVGYGDCWEASECVHVWM